MTTVDDATAAAGRADDAAPAPADGAPVAPEAASSRGRRALLVLGLTAVVALPLFVALGALRTPRWSPLLDLAMTEMRVRDVGSRHTPLVGLLGRLSSDGEQGSHLGPLSFWLLAPTYRVLGSSAWGLLVGVVVLNVTAIATTLWIALRRGGTALAVGFAAALAVLVHVYGTMVLTEPWNPYMPVLWWTLTLVALWAVAVRRPPDAAGGGLRGVVLPADPHLLRGPGRRLRRRGPRGVRGARRPPPGRPPGPPTADGLVGGRPRARRGAVAAADHRPGHGRPREHVDRRRPLPRPRGRADRGRAWGRAVRGAPRPVALRLRRAGDQRLDGAGRPVRAPVGRGGGGDVAARAEGGHPPVCAAATARGDRRRTRARLRVVDARSSGSCGSTSPSGRGASRC